MADIKYYSEEELIEKMQSGEYGYLDYVNHYSTDWQHEYEEYCKTNCLEIGEESAEAFVHFKDKCLEDAMDEGDA